MSVYVKENYSLSWSFSSIFSMWNSDIECLNEGTIMLSGLERVG